MSHALKGFLRITTEALEKPSMERIFECTMSWRQCKSGLIDIMNQKNLDYKDIRIIQNILPSKRATQSGWTSIWGNRDSKRRYTELHHFQQKQKKSHKSPVLNPKRSNSSNLHLHQQYAIHPSHKNQIQYCALIKAHNYCDFHIITKQMKLSKIEYFLYNPKADLPVKYIIKHIPTNIPIAGISEDLIATKIFFVCWF